MAKTKGRGGDGIGGQYRRGLWAPEEDKILMDYVAAHGEGRWNVIAKRTGNVKMEIANRSQLDRGILRALS